VQEILEILLTDWEGHSVEVKRIFFESNIQPLRLHERNKLLDEGAILNHLSPRGQLAGVKSPVFILHDAADWIVPPNHSLQMYAELTQRGEGFRQEILVTPWLSHVVLQNTGNLSELSKIVSFTAELFR
jgi:dipeptidyl aminopeptidase/acylaminoacyl peptidase